MKHYDRVWAEIDLDAFSKNLKWIGENTDPGTKIIGVIKTDGYGHGAVPLARLMEEEPKVGGYATATAEEAFILRRAGILKPVLVLGYTFPYAYEEMAEEGIRATVFTEEMLEQMSAAALRQKKTMAVHIAVDTGMSRIGIRPDEAGLKFAERACRTPGIAVEGIFTHFARADEADKSSACRQLEEFSSFVRRVETKLSVSIPVIHCSNSAALLEMREANFDAVRAGIILYGLWPSGEENRSLAPLSPVLSLYSRVVYVKELEAGRQISYGGTYTTAAPMRVATVPVGYGDGYPRMLSNRGEVLICGKRARILGRVCMDQFMVDVTDIPEAAAGTKVTLIGQDEAERITMEELGRLSGRFNYELACCIGKRVPRVYKKGGEVTAVRDYFEDYR